MKRLTSILCAAAMTLTSVAVPVVSASAAPLQPIKVETPNSDIQQVNFRHGFYRGGYGPRFYRRGAFRGGYYGRGYGYRGYGYRRGGWWPGAAIAGAIIGGAIAGPGYGYYGYGPYGGYGYPYGYRCNSWHCY